MKEFFRRISYIHKSGLSWKESVIIAAEFTYKYYAIKRVIRQDMRRRAA
jgi:hypothetical protein